MSVAARIWHPPNRSIGSRSTSFAARPPNAASSNPPTHPLTKTARHILLPVLALGSGALARAQSSEPLASLSLLDGDSTEQCGSPATVEIDGHELELLVTPDGDTIFIATSLSAAAVSSPRSFESADDQKLYRKYRYYAAKVYPYAVEAIRIFRETEHVTATMPQRQAKRHIRRLSKELKKEFEDPLKGLTKTQGYLLVKMIERETGQPMHSLIKDLRGTLTATYWNTLGKTVGYQLKDGYVVGADPILDVVLQDYDVSHEVAER